MVHLVKMRWSRNRRISGDSIEMYDKRILKYFDDDQNKVEVILAKKWYLQLSKYWDY